MSSSSSKDYKLEHVDTVLLGGLARTLNVDATRTDALRPTVQALSDNITRVKQLAAMPSISLMLERVYWAGYYQQPEPEFESAMKGWTRSVQRFADDWPSGVEAWLSSLLLGTWTAFETFAGDLWVAALNANPHLLARLGGTEKRIHRQAKAAAREEAATSKQENDMMIPIRRIHDISNGKFDISMKMGDLLKSKVAFTRLWDIRRAYSRAFDEKKFDKKVVAWIDSVLADKALDALSSVRNLIVHKASIADDDYIKSSNVINKTGLVIPQLDKGQLLQLDGELTKSLVDPVIMCCLKLLAGVDTWLYISLSPPGYEAGAGI